MDSGASVSRLWGNGGSEQDPLSAPGHGCPLCWAGKPSQVLIPLETALLWPRPSHEAPAGRVLLQRVQQRCLMPSASLSPVAPSASALRIRGIGCPDPGALGSREEPEFVTARAGESVILGCDVIHPLTGQPPPYVVEWFKFGVPIPIFIKFGFYPPHVDPEYAGRASLHDKASLRIEQVRSEDQGWYECKVLMLDQQYDTFHNGSWVHLTVNAPPTFTETPPQYVEAKEGSSVTLTCMAFGNPKPIVTWLREGDLLGANGKYQVSDGSLTVLSVSREDRGAYTCRAYSIQGEAVHTTRLLVQGPPFIVSPPENITVNISQDALFTCQAEAYPGNLTYLWYWEEENVYFKNDLKLRVRILIDGTLIIFRVKPEDAGKYTCIPSNSLGRSPSASAYLTVQYPARVVNMPPIIYVPIGIHGYIRCPVEAEPPVTLVKWNKDGRPLRIEKYAGWNLLEDGSIRIEEATEDALGTYTCVPYNALGTMGQSPPARLVLKDPPYFTVLPGWEYRQEAGRELLIPCAAAGDPFPIIAWRKVGKPSRSKHNTLPGGTLQIRSLGKDDHGEWECVATNIVASITASTHLTVVGTSPHAPTSVHVVAAMTSANVSWEPGYDGGYEQTFSVWMKRAQFGPHDWLSLPVPAGSSWLLVDTLEPETAYQFSVLAQNKLGTSSFSEVVTVNTLAFPVTTPEPLVLVTPPRCLTANRTQQGVLLSWLPPANHSFPIDRYIMEFRVAEKWEILDDGIPGSENEFFAKDLSQDTWYEFRVLAVMQDLISEPSNVAGVSSTDVFPQPDLTDEGLARPVLAGIVATICFLAAAILFSTLAACFVNKQRKRKLKRKKDPPLSITHCRKSLESPLSSGKVSPESIRTLRPPSESSDDQGPQAKRMLSPTKEKELSLYKKTKRAISSKKYSVSKAEAEAEATTPIELISRGPDGRFVMDPAEMEPSLKTRRIEGFPFVEETDMYPEFRQSDEENDDPVVPTSVTALKAQLTPLSSSQESYLQPPAYSPRFHRALEGPGALQATGQARPPAPRAFHHQFYGYLSSSSPGEVDPPPFYMPEVSPLSSVMSSPPLPPEGPFGHPTIPEENGENASNSTLPLAQTPTGGRSPEPWGRAEFPFGSLELAPAPFPHQLQPCEAAEGSQPTGCLPRGPPPSSLQVVPASYSGILPLEAPKSWTGKSPGRGQSSVPTTTKWQDKPMQPMGCQGQLRHTSQGMGIPVLPYHEPSEPVGPSGTSTFSLDTRWYEPQPRPRPSPRQVRRAEPSLHQVVLQPSRLSPLTQSPLSSRNSSPELTARARPRPGLIQQAEVSEITLQPPAARALMHDRNSYHGHRPICKRDAAAPGRGQGEIKDLATPAACQERRKNKNKLSPAEIGRLPARSDPALKRDVAALDSSGWFSRKCPSPPGDAAAPERFKALKYQRIKKPKKSSKGSSKSRKQPNGSASQVQHPPSSQVLSPDEAVCLRKKKRHPRQDPFARLSALKDDLCHRQLPEDQTAILNSVDHDDTSGHATLL
ncbi:PREDICTED: protein turtle homolog B [Corvus brachyrhynchos]|uniref:protein turtle homolog B n=1 Tax=Corvus brachyrhynchos TaxID=85066 RepID=UPI00081666ED|nr:PREDICTED: protein turtle homolog B [Corvus brachyrhynchos]